MLCTPGAHYTRAEAARQKIVAVEVFTKIVSNLIKEIGHIFTFLTLTFYRFNFPPNAKPKPAAQIWLEISRHDSNICNAILMTEGFAI